MKALYYTSILFLLFSCSEKEDSGEKNEADKVETVEKEVVVPEFQTMVDSANALGSILIYDLEADKYYSNDFDWCRKGNLPASTFKIPNSIIALETGVVEDDSTLFKWDGAPRNFKIWEQDLVFKEAIHFSCVPCYQEVARKVGVERMQEHLNKLNYGNMDVDSSNLDLFWLEGKSRITQFEQIDFLKRLYLSELPVSQRTETIMKRMIVIEENEAYKLSGKTGLSISSGTYNGWFVGFVESQNKTHFFATNVEPKEQLDTDLFPKVRKEVTYKALRQMGIVK